MESFSVSLLSGIEKVWIRGGGVSRFFVEKFLSHNAKKPRRGGESFSFSLLSGIEKVWLRGGWEYQDFSWKNFCLTVPKNSVGGG